jgi:hypothetical protein
LSCTVICYEIERAEAALRGEVFIIGKEFAGEPGKNLFGVWLIKLAFTQLQTEEMTRQR